MSHQKMIILKNTMLLILLLIAFLLSHSVFALEIKYSRIDPVTGGKIQSPELILRGEIRPGDYDNLLNVLSKDPPSFLLNRWIFLATPGGDVEEAMKIARLVKSVYATVEVYEQTGRCVSAGFLIFASAANRLATPGYVGIHRPYIDPRRLASLSPSQAMTLQNDAFRQARSYLQELQIPTSLIDTMFQRASSEVYWLSKADLKQIGQFAPWYEQFLIGRCGLDKAIFTPNGQDLAEDLAKSEHWAKVVFCGNKLTFQEAGGFLTSEFRKTGKLNERQEKALHEFVERVSSIIVKEK